MSIEKDNWWYYFDKIENGKYAKCKNCNWQKDRGTHKSSNILKNHLENSHSDLYQQKLTSGQEKLEKERKRKLQFEQQQSFFVKKSDGIESTLATTSKKAKIEQEKPAKITRFLV